MPTAADAPERSPEARLLAAEQREPEQSVLRPLDEGHRHALADLAGVVQPEPLVREVTAAGDHELGTEDPPERPAGDEGWHERVA